jgi:phosphoserine phosphatase RsbU/P
LVQTPDLYSGAVVGAAFRRDAIDLFLGAILMAAGLLAFVIFKFRRKTEDRGLFWFGLFTGLYGLRLLCSADLFQLGMDFVPRQFWNYFRAAITYSISPVSVLFLRDFFPGAPALRRPVPWLVAFAAIGVLADQILHRPNSLQLGNNVIVIAWFLLLLAALYRNQTAENLRVVRAWAMVLAGAVLITNVLPFYNPILPPALDYLEPIAFTGFLASLGVVVVRRLFQNEEQLIALNKELDVARKIQASILPRETPQSHLVSFATRYLSMTAVAGDFYDFLVVDENRFGVLIADVSGHGVPAALVASMVKIAASAQLPHAADPAAVLAGMNRILCGKMQNQFVTAAYAFLDLEKGYLHYGAAGHPPLLCRDSQNTFDSVTENGLMLGLFPAASYTSIRRPLSNGSRLLLYTDGLLEAGDSGGQFFGEEQVRQTLFDAAALTAEDCATLLVDRVRRWTGNRQDDDLTLIVIDVHA